MKPLFNEPELPRFTTEDDRICPGCPDCAPEEAPFKEIHGWDILSPEQQEELDQFNRRFMK